MSKRGKYLSKMKNLKHKYRRKFLKRNPTTLDHLRVSEVDGQWFVLTADGLTKAGPMTNSECWSWIDHNQFRGIANG